MRGGRRPVAEAAAYGGEVGVSEHRGRGREGSAPASELYPDVHAASVHRLKDGDCFAFLHLSPKLVSTSAPVTLYHARPWHRAAISRGS